MSVNKRLKSTWICNTRPWSSLSREGTVFVLLLLPEEPDAELLACPVVVEVGFLDLRIFFFFLHCKSVLTCYKRKWLSIDLNNNSVRMKSVNFRTAFVKSSGRWRDYEYWQEINMTQEICFAYFRACEITPGKWLACTCLRPASSSFLRLTSFSHMFKSSSFHAWSMLTDFPSAHGRWRFFQRRVLSFQSQFKVRPCKLKR